VAANQVLSAVDQQRGTGDRLSLGEEHDGAGDVFRPAGVPERGAGALDAVGFLAEHGLPASTATTGPKFFHFVVGGVTPAAFGADLLTALLDQPAYAWASSPLGVHLEVLALRWLRELFELPVPELAYRRNTFEVLPDGSGILALSTASAEGRSIRVTTAW